MMQSVNTTVHNGVPSYWTDSAGLSTGTLVFGVGLRDEPATLAGITHLVEHAVLRMVQPVTMPHGGIVKADSVEFYAAGDAEAVAGFLNAVAMAISTFSAITEEDLALEKTIIEAEDPDKFSAVSSGLLTYRFGTSGPGAAHFGAPATTGLTKSEAIEWAERWLTTENAAVTFTGPLPDALNIRLPPGGAVSREQSHPIVMTPTLIRSKKSGVALSFIVPSRNAGFLGEALRHELLSRLRHNGGLIYSVVVFTTEIDTDESQLDLILDPVEPNIVPTLRASLDAVRGIALTGFSAAAIQSAYNEHLIAMGWDESVPPDYLDQLAVGTLLGRATPSREELLERAKELSSSELTATLKTCLDSLLAAVDRNTRLRKSDTADLGMRVDAFEIWQRVSGSTDQRSSGDIPDGYPKWRNKSSKAAIWITPTRLMMRNSGKTMSIHLEDIAVVGDRSCGCISLTDRRGRTGEIDVDEWKGGQKLRRKLLEAFTASIVRSFPEK